MSYALYMKLSLFDNRVERDTAMVQTIRHAKDAGFDTLLLLVASYQEFPDAPRNPIVLRAISLARALDLKVIWGRNLWVSWPKYANRVHPAAPPITEAHHLDVGWYAAAIGRVQAEARALGIEHTAFDIEPYGDAYETVLKGVDLGIELLTRIAFTMRQATKITGMVDYVLPAASGAANRLQWTGQLMGMNWMQETTYRAKTEADYRIPTPPVGFEPYRHDVWGTHVTLRTDFVTGPLSPGENFRLDVTTPRWVYITVSEYADVMSALAILGRPTP